MRNHKTRGIKVKAFGVANHPKSDENTAQMSYDGRQHVPRGKVLFSKPPIDHHSHVDLNGMLSRGSLLRAEWLNVPFTAENGKRDRIENCHQWRGGRGSSKLALINQINALDSVVVLFARKQRGGVSRKFDPFLGQFGEMEFNHF